MLNKKSTTSEGLSRKASSILNVFNQTINNLTKIVKQAKELVKVKEEEIAAAQIEKESLEKVASENQAVVNKLKSMLS